MPTSVSRLELLLPELFQTKNYEGKLYLRCQINTTITVLMAMEYVQESLLIPREQITTLPQLPPFFMGLMTSRDHVFLTVDLPQLLGFSPLSTYSREYHIIVINISAFLDPSLALERERFLGLAVNQIEGMMRLTTTQILPPQDASLPRTIPYIGGVARQEATLIPILDLNPLVTTLAQTSLG